ncbi:MAG TPA: cytochrome d ubiquinol oxidase subunit II [Terriglobales bacterium]|nr:cytochrome d ubiquinol oxidase subunit II [Terriglobales bacterium]
MNLAWFWMLAAMLTTFAVLDGYDLGVGALHLRMARGEAQRRTSINAIGPLWDGNEVWLIASGGMLVVAFPRLYAAAFSGFYLALMLVLWLLVLRGVAIEFRGHVRHPLWASFWDATFSLASLLLALLLGVALGNVVRGVPLQPGGYFLGSFALMLNPYALLTGLLSVVVLSWHGANFLRTKTESELQQRARRWSRALGWAALALALAATAATWSLRPDVLANFGHYPVALLLPALAALGWFLGRSANDCRALLGSVLAIVGLLGAAAATVVPNLLRSTLNPAFSLTVYNAAAGPHGLRVAFLANALALAAVVTYTFYIHHSFRGPARLDEHSY